MSIFHRTALGGGFLLSHFVIISLSSNRLADFTKNRQR